MARIDDHDSTAETSRDSIGEVMHWAHAQLHFERLLGSLRAQGTSEPSGATTAEPEPSPVPVGVRPRLAFRSAFPERRATLV